MHQDKFLNRFILRMYVTNAASTKGFGVGVGGFSNGTLLSGLYAFKQKAGGEG